MKPIEREKLRTASKNLKKISRPPEMQYRISSANGEHHFYSRRQTYPQIICSCSIGGNRVDSAEVETLYNRDDATKSKYSLE